jgi:gluconolactonase
VVADDFDQPNGLAFSADQKRLFVVDSGRGHLRAFAVTQDQLSVTQDQLVGGEVFATCHAGIFDGIRLDHQGRVWAAAQDGLHCLAPDGTLIGKLKVPETVSNFCFGGRQRNHLFITASTSLYTMRVNFSGVVYP